ncbi:uncharacterized protein LOC120846961 [Ixodes scapularis]|uniref:uncharacterized protein LOC120846961 n=1 Tax=Ixodes scapularis TaxID=6945 RepID=UPI001A9FF3CC|nr:uncharacterized protein LOC120846961 [Ixodes scapularis]
MHSQARNQPQKFQTLKAPDVAVQPLNRNYADEQEENESLKPRFSQIGKKLMCRDSEGKIDFQWEGGLLYRSYTEKTGRMVRRLVVPRCHREAVSKLAHDGIMAGHFGEQKAKDRISDEFFWPGITADVKRFVTSCDICQTIIPKGRAVALPSVERVAEALVKIFSRFGLPNKVLSNRGTDFTSDLMKEVAQLLFIRQLHTMPYHPTANGMVERFNGTLKLMLKRMWAEKPRLGPGAVASLGFSPFELLCGWHVRGPLAILKELWTNYQLDEEEKTTYHHVQFSTKFSTN